jgi:peroxiredoxin
MKHLKLIIFLFSCGLSTIAFSQDSLVVNRGYTVKVGQQSPDFEFQLLNGETVNNESLKGKVTVLQFTASWCSVCRKEMPHLEAEVWQRFKEDDFMLIGLDLKEDEETAKAFAEKMGVTYPMASDLDGSLFNLFAGPKQGVTRNIVLNRKGEIIFLTRLYEREEFEEMIRVIDLELKKK